MIVDNHTASIGTANWDRLSFFKNYEITSIIYDKDTIEQLQNDFLNDLKDSTTRLPAAIKLPRYLVTNSRINLLIFLHRYII